MPEQIPSKVIEQENDDDGICVEDDNSNQLIDCNVEDVMSSNNDDQGNADRETVNLSTPVASSHGFTVDQFCETDLLKILNDRQAPHGMCQETLD